MAETATAAVIDADLLGAFCRAVGEDLGMLAALHDREPDAALIRKVRTSAFPATLGLKLVSKGGEQASRQMSEGIAALPREIEPEALDRLCADYADIYLNHTLRASPLESVWTDEENIAYQQSMFQIREFYERYGVKAENWRLRSDDHLVLQLLFIAHLMKSGPDQKVLADVARFMDDHLLRWLPEFAQRVATRCETPYFAGLALLTDAYTEELRQLLEQILGEARPAPEEIEKRMNPQAVSATETPLKFVPGSAASW
ncbi:MAG: molecular chaperone TorD family protein [Pseudomonadota bacterium]|nr:molecular chaperone TorD family protein [Pseudomonadota bacterium]